MTLGKVTPRLGSRNSRQRSVFALSIAIVVLSGLFLMPFISRGFSSDGLTRVSILLLLNSFFGTFDVLRPAYVMHYANRPEALNWRALTVPPLVFSAFMCPLALLLALLFYSDVFSTLELVTIATSLALFLVYSAFWSVLDIVDLVGTGYLIRAIGTMVLYTLFSVAAVTGGERSVVIIFAACHVIIAAAYLIKARPFVRSGVGVPTVSLYEAAVSIFQQNIAKMFIDYADRFVISQSLTASYVASYILSFEIVSKSNLPAQLLSNYAYPALCRKELEVSRFLDTGMVIAILLTFVGAIISVFGEPAVRFYFGRDDPALHPIFSILTSVFALYSLAFFSQAALRSVHQLRLLVLTFVAPAVMGGVLMSWLYFKSGFAGLVICVFIMRSPGIIGILTYGGFTLRHKILTSGVFLANLAMFGYNLEHML